MKHFLGVALLLLSKFGYGQIVFDELYFKDDFDEVTEVWDQRFSGSDFLITQNGRYVMKHTAETGVTTSFPKIEANFKTVAVSAELLIKKTKNKKNNGGLILWANNNGSAAIFLEFNYKGRLRVKKINGTETILLTPVKNDGWVKIKGFKKGKFNLIEAKGQTSGWLEIYVNGNLSLSRELGEAGQGRVGLVVGGNSEMEVESFKIHVVKGADVSPNENDKPEGSFDDILLIFRNKIELQQREIMNLQNDLNICRNTSGVDTSARRQNADLAVKNQELMKRITKMEAELEEKNKRLEFLESMKTDLEKSSNGDLIINLTQLLAQEKKDKEEYKKDLQRQRERNADLKIKIEELKLKISELEKQ